MDLKYRIRMLAAIHEVRPLTKTELKELEEYRKDILTLIDAALMPIDLVWYYEILWDLAEVDYILFQYSKEFRESSSSQG